MANEKDQKKETKINAAIEDTRLHIDKINEDLRLKIRERETLEKQLAMLVAIRQSEDYI